MRRAFYTGALSTFNVITNIPEPNESGKEVSDEEAAEGLFKLQAELTIFFSKVGKEF